jgi:hypothetical protein
MLSLIISKALLMSTLPSKFSKVAYPHKISKCYFPLTSNSSSFLRSNLSTSKFCLAHLLTEFLSLNFATTNQWSVSQSVPLKDRTSNVFECHLLFIKAWSI